MQPGRRSSLSLSRADSLLSYDSCRFDASATGLVPLDPVHGFFRGHRFVVGLATPFPVDETQTEAANHGTAKASGGTESMMTRSTGVGEKMTQGGCCTCW